MKWTTNNIRVFMPAHMPYPHSANCWVSVAVSDVAFGKHTTHVHSQTPKMWEHIEWRPQLNCIFKWMAAISIGILNSEINAVSNCYSWVKWARMKVVEFFWCWATQTQLIRSRGFELNGIRLFKSLTFLVRMRQNDKKKTLASTVPVKLDPQLCDEKCFWFSNPPTTNFQHASTANGRRSWWNVRIFPSISSGCLWESGRERNNFQLRENRSHFSNGLCRTFFFFITGRFRNTKSIFMKLDSH